MYERFKMKGFRVFEHKIALYINARQGGFPGIVRLDNFNQLLKPSVYIFLSLSSM